MGLFDQLGQSAQNKQVNSQQAFQSDLASLKSDPIAYAKSHGKNIPNGMTDPNQMIQYLLNSTQVNNPRYQMALRLINNMAGKR